MASDKSGGNEGWRVDSLYMTWCVGMGTPCPSPTPSPTATPTPTPAPRASCPQYTIAESAGAIVPGTTDTGNHCVWCSTLITLPFPFVLYNQAFNAVNVTSSGRLAFVCDNEPGGYRERCLPASPYNCDYDFTIFALWYEWVRSRIRKAAPPGRTGAASLPQFQALPRTGCLISSGT